MPLLFEENQCRSNSLRQDSVGLVNYLNNRLAEYLSSGRREKLERHQCTS